MWHAGGTDLAPYTRLFEVFRERIEGRPVPEDPAAATFLDGAAGQAVLDAIHQSSTEHMWVTVEPVTPR
jgi:predicted dehydrogenase